MCFNTSLCMKNGISGAAKPCWHLLAVIDVYRDFIGVRLVLRPMPSSCVQRRPWKPGFYGLTRVKFLLELVSECMLKSRSSFLRTLVHIYFIDEIHMIYAKASCSAQKQ